MTTTDIDALKEDNARYLWHPMAHPQAMQKSKPDIVARGQGCWIWDVDGHKMLDGVGGLWAANLGHSNRAVRDAIVAQLDELPFYNVFRGTTHPRAIELSKRIVQTMEPDGVAAVFFSNGGSDAVEGALKLARQYWKLRGQADRHKFIALRQGYHGVHFGGMSVNGNLNFRRAYEPLLPGCFHVDTPWLYRNPYTQDPEELGEICATLLEREIQFQGPDTVAAFIAEPIQGAGGVIVPPPNYWPRVREICDKYGVLLILDEVMCGMGRTGTLHACEQEGVVPDLMTIAKGLGGGYQPVGAVLAQRGVVDAMSRGSGFFQHGHTYLGHPMACAAALAVQQTIRREGLVAKVREDGTAFGAMLAEALGAHPHVGDIRGRGFFWGLELVAERAGRTPFDPALKLHAAVKKEAMARGLLCYPFGGTVDGRQGDHVLLAPPFIATREELREIAARLADAIDAVTRRAAG